MIWIVVEQLIHDRYPLVLVAINSRTVVIKVVQKTGMSRHVYSLN